MQSHKISLFLVLELDEKMVRIINDALQPHPESEVLVNAFDISIMRKDIQTLRGLNWLNDEVINYYISMLVERSKNTDTRTYAFTTFFYPKLAKDGYSTLRRWTRKVDLFAFDLVLVPIHLGHHWTLAIIDFKCKEIRYYDSMNGNNMECLNSLR